MSSDCSSFIPWYNVDVMDLYYTASQVLSWIRDKTILSAVTPFIKVGEVEHFVLAAGCISYSNYTTNEK